MRRTNVDDMTFAVDHDITVVPILDLQDIACNRIRRHRLNEVQARSLELESILSTIPSHEEVQKVVDLGTSHFVTRGGIGYHVDNATLPSA